MQKRGEEYHFIGIGGIGMSSLARLLRGKNYKISGSDKSITDLTQKLEGEGCLIHVGHSAAHITPSMRVVYSTDIKSDNPEFQAALQLKCDLLHRSDLLAELATEYRSMAVTGTHGKTTTSALLASVLYQAGSDPSFSVGGILPQFQSNSRFGKGDLFVFEADESDGSFLKYSPYGAIVTNIDNDHLNYFENNEEKLIAAFGIFMDQVKSKAHLFWCGDDVHLSALKKPGVTYGFSELCEWRIVSFRQIGFKVFFDILHNNHCYKEIELALTGEHNALNATAIFGLSITLGISESDIRQAFKDFQGVWRRCQHKGVWQGADFLDDYAHHPTEIKATLKAIRKAIQDRRMIVLFQPHRYSRTKDCMGKYGTAFEYADEVLITEIFSAGEAPLSISSQDILSEIQSESSTYCCYINRCNIADAVRRIARPGDVIVTMGAGDITKVCGEVLKG